MDYMLKEFVKEIVFLFYLYFDGNGHAVGNVAAE